MQNIGQFTETSMFRLYSE